RSERKGTRSQSQCRTSGECGSQAHLPISLGPARTVRHGGNAKIIALQPACPALDGKGLVNLVFDTLDDDMGGNSTSKIDQQIEQWSGKIVRNLFADIRAINFDDVKVGV